MAASEQPARPARLWRPRVARAALVALAALALAALAFAALDARSWIEYYRVLEDRTLVVGTSVGPGAWTRVTSVNESATSVTIIVSSFWFQLGPGAAYAVPVESIAKLHDPLGDRVVVDGSDGHTVVRTRCLPPSYLAPGCT